LNRDGGAKISSRRVKKLIEEPFQGIQLRWDFNRLARVDMSWIDSATAGWRSL
jgi:hypothetical protein